MCSYVVRVVCEYICMCMCVFIFMYLEYVDVCTSNMYVPLCICTMPYFVCIQLCIYYLLIIPLVPRASDRLTWLQVKFSEFASSSNN